MQTIRLTKPNEGEHFLAATDVVTIKATGRDTADSMLVVEVRVPPGGGPPVLHRHPSSKVFYFLDGEFDIATADAESRLSTIRAEAGDTVSIPSMVWHNIKNVGTATGRYIGVHSPAGVEQFLREISQPISDPLNPPKPAGPPSEAQQHQLMSVILKHMEVLTPDKPSYAP